MGDKGRMNDRQKAFVEYYIGCGNATEAAKKAGYSKKTAYSIGNENLKKPEILEYIKNRTTPTEQRRIASADQVLQFFTDVMDGKETGAKITDRIWAGREILKRDIDGRKLEIELLKLESRQKEEMVESDIDDAMLKALNASAIEVWGGGDDGSEIDGCAKKESNC